MAHKESFVHLTVQSSFTPGALGNVQEYARDAKIFGMPAVGVADTHSVGIWNKHEEACQANDLKPLFGITLHPQVDDTPYPVSLLVQERSGFNSIYQLAQMKKGAITFDDLLDHQDGLIAIAPEPSHEILRTGFDPKKLFFDYINFDDIQSRIQLTEQMKRAQTMNAQVVVTNHVWRATQRLYDQFLSQALYAHRTKQKIPMAQLGNVNWAENSQVYNRIGRTIRGRFLVDGLAQFNPEGWLKPPSMMRNLMGQRRSNQFDEWQLACDNTVIIADMIEPEELPRASMPEYPVPEGHTQYSYLYERCLKGLETRYPEVTQQVLDRLDQEMNMIGERQLESMFLIVGDITDVVRQQMLHEGIGSATCSLICYALGITNVDPIEHDLLFERFMGPVESVKPDIDIQADAEKAQEINNYLFSHFPEKGIYVAYISTLGTYRMDGALELLLKTFGYSEQERRAVKQYLKLHPDAPSSPLIKMGDTSVPTHLLEAQQSLVARTLYERTSRHPSKVIFSGTPFEETHMVTQSKRDGQPQIHEDREDVSRHGEMEFDTVKTYSLTLLDRALAFHGMKREDIPHENPRVLQEIFRANIVGIPGIETPWLRTVLYKYGQMKGWRDLSEKDLSLAFALSRPNVEDSYRTLFYQQLKQGKAFSYEHPMIDSILGESYGIAIFQEQLMQLVSTIGGFTAQEADVVRRQISKERDPQKLAEAAQRFFLQATTQGVSQENAHMLVDQMMHFLHYGFVKGHAIALMSNIAYELTYLKYLNPHAFLEHVEKLGKGHYYQRGNPEAYDDERERLRVSTF